MPLVGKFANVIFLDHLGNFFRVLFTKESGGVIKPSVLADRFRSSHMILNIGGHIVHLAFYNQPAISR